MITVVKSLSLSDRAITGQTRRALGGAHVPPTKVFRRLTGSVNNNVKPRVAAAANTYTWDFLDLIFRVAALIR